jgi:hypothetical protein
MTKSDTTIWLIRLDACGAKLWEMTLGGSDVARYWDHPLRPVQFDVASPRPRSTCGKGIRDHHILARRNNIPMPLELNYQHPT